MLNPVSGSKQTHPRIKRTVKIDPVRSGIVAIGELHRAHLADNHGAHVDQPLDRRSGSIPGRIEVVVGAVAAAGLEALEVEDVLDAHAELVVIHRSADVTPWRFMYAR